jgi:hypothetical protein
MKQFAALLCLMSLTLSLRLPLLAQGEKLAKETQEENQSTAANDWMLVPSQRMGFAILGQSRAEYVDSLRANFVDAKITAKNHAYGVEEIIARYKNDAPGIDVQFEVLLQNGRIVQVSASDQQFNVEGGYNTGTQTSQFQAHFLGMKSTKYYFSVEPGALSTTILDQVEEGLTLAEEDLGEKAAYLSGGSRYPSFLTVHNKNRPYIPIWDGARGSTKQTPPKPPPALKPIKLTGVKLKSAQKALRAIKKLRTVIEVGTTYNDYSNRVVDAALEVNEGLASVPQSDFRKEVKEAMEAFKNARDSWNTARENNVMGIAERLRDVFWDKAIKHVSKAEKLLQ